jgi:hypothetical protein
MARVMSTAHPHDDVADAEGEGAFVEREASSEASAERTESAQASDAGSHSGAGADADEGMCSRRCYF